MLSDFMTKLSVLPHSSASVDSLVNHFKTKTNSLKQTYC